MLEQYLELKRKPITDDIRSLTDIYGGIDNLFRFWKDINVIKDYNWMKKTDYSRNHEGIETYFITCTPPLPDELLGQVEKVFNYEIIKNETK